MAVPRSGEYDFALVSYERKMLQFWDNQYNQTTDKHVIREYFLINIFNSITILFAMVSYDKKMLQFDAINIVWKREKFWNCQILHSWKFFSDDVQQSITLQWSAMTWKCCNFYAIHIVRQRRKFRNDNVAFMKISSREYNNFSMVNATLVQWNSQITKENLEWPNATFKKMFQTTYFEMVSYDMKILQFWCNGIVR